MAKTFNMAGGGGGGIKLASIEITTAPDKLAYLAGETFDPAGMAVTATYTNGAAAIATGWTYSPTGALAEGDTVITVLYTEGGVTKTDTVTVTASVLSVAIPTVSGNLTYNGNSQSPAWNGYDAEYMTIGGTTSAVSAGTYQAVFTLKDTTGTKWADGTTTAKDVSWTIERAAVAVPSQSGSLTYTGGAQSPSWSGYDPAKMTIGGVTSGVDAGTYTATFTPNSNYKWNDGSTSAKNVNWTIERAIITNVPSQSGTLTYNGNSQSPTWVNYDSAKMSIGGTTSGVNAGTFTAVFTPKSNYKWSDGSTTSKSVSWTIERAVISNVPSQSGTLTYNGNNQSPNWSNYDPSKMTIGGTTSSVNAGTFTATFTPNSNYKWSDGGIGAKNVDWTINKATGSMSVSPGTIELNMDSPTGTITVTRPGDGAITAQSNNTGVAAVSVSGNIVTVSNVNQTSGEAIITISVAEGTNYTAPASKTVAVSAEFVRELNECTPAQIQQFVRQGIAPNIWAVGDVTAGITLNGTVGILTFSNETYYAYILGFDHNADIEGSNTVHFQFGKNANNKNITFRDDAEIPDDTPAFRMSLNTSNSGGWASSYMRGTICPAFLAVMPTEWRSIVSTCTKYTDNKGGGTTTARNVTSTSDTIWIPAEFEVYGSRRSANNAEQNYQEQYTYYAIGNSKVKYAHDSPNTASDWWLRSVVANSAWSFIIVSTRGSVSDAEADESFGFAPCFMVA